MISLWTTKKPRKPPIRIEWTCNAAELRPLLNILQHRNKKISNMIRDKMGIPLDQKISLKIHCKEVPVEYINRYWDNLVFLNMRKLLELESVLWNLSTFGGAFSSMGDYDETWAEKAGKVSQSQLKLAREMGNDTLEARCYLYMALSDAQLGKIDEAKQHVRIIHAYAKRTNNEFLKNCSRGVFYKIKDIVHYLKRRSNKSV